MSNPCKLDETTQNKIAYAIGYEKGYAEAIKEIEEAMYHQCFECDNDEDMQKWDSGNWIRYKLFEKVMKQVKEKNNDK